MALTHDQMLAFVLKMTKHGLDTVQKMADGGTVLQDANPTAISNTSTPGGVAGGLGGLLGTTNNFKASVAPIQQGTNAAQLNNAYTGAQGALGNANGLAGALQPGTNQGLDTQNLLTQQLIGQTQGIGPNPAAAALNQATGRNIDQQAALNASVRGAGSNAGLVATQNARVGGDIQQQAAAQAAQLQAAQALAAQEQLKGLAGQQVGQGIGGVQLQNQVNQGEQALLQGANEASNNAVVSQQNSINAVNAYTAKANQESGGGLLGGLGSALGGIGGFILGGPPGALAGASLGGQLGNAGKKAFGGKVLPPHLHKIAALYHPEYMRGYGDGGTVPGTPEVNHDAYKNDKVPALLTPGETVIDLDTLHRKDKLGKMARFVAKNIERKKMGRSA